MINLKEASRDELIRLIVHQHEGIAMLERTVEQLQEANATLTAQITQLTARVTALLVALEAGWVGMTGVEQGAVRRKGCRGINASPPRRVLPRHANNARSRLCAPAPCPPRR